MYQSIKHLSTKIKVFITSAKEEILVMLIIILVGFGSYGLGRLSVNQSEGARIEIIKASQASLTPPKDALRASVPTESSNTASVVVASKSGKKYHFPWCAGAKQIAEKNKIIFNSKEEARHAGYTPAANCKGLE